jgi:rhodanese-related sulfurtransferase
VGQGDVLELDNLEISVMDTPGHTPEHVSYTVVDRSRGREPVCVFCGDTLFVGDVGRPDLFPGMAQELAEKLYDSIHGKLMKLPDFCEVLPAHGAGSLCGRAMGAKRTSTIGYERLFNSAVRIPNQSEFVESLTHNMPGAPDHFTRCSAVNAAGPVLTGTLPKIADLTPTEFAREAARDDTIVLDVRLFEAFGGMHVPGSWSIDLTGNFTTFAGWLLPPDKQILLVCDSRDSAEYAALLLRRVGLDQSFGMLEGSMYAWAKEGRNFQSVGQVSAHELLEWLNGGTRFQLLDVRALSEYSINHIKGSINIPVPEIRTRYTELDESVPTVVVCNSGHRSTMACAILQQRGFTKVYNVAGGMLAVGATGKAMECHICAAPETPKSA